MRRKGRTQQEIEFTISEAAARLGLSTETLRNLEKRGALMPRRIKRHGALPLRLYRQSDLDKFLRHYAIVGGPRVLAKT